MYVIILYNSLIILYPLDKPLEMEQKKQFKILAWHHYYGGRPWFGYGNGPFRKCEFSNCFITANKQEYNKSDAVMVDFNGRFEAARRILPKCRPAQQKWIVAGVEPPFYVRYHMNFKNYNNLFNATWTYHSKSDIWTNHSNGFFVKRTTKELNNIDNSYVQKNYLKGKEIMISWLVSHCNTSSKREHYVRKLQKYIPVNIYGACGKLSCPKNSNECEHELQRSKFYLAFESSICDEYISKKIFHAIRNNIIPVVMGAGKYLRVLPPNSYIDVKDFKSPKALAEYLVKVSDNVTLYNSYLAYKWSHRFVKYQPSQCFVCEYLNKNYGKKKTYPRLDMFWNPIHDCYSLSNFYQNIEKWW